LLLFTSTGIFTTIQAQLSKGGLPRSFQKLVSSDDIPFTQLPEVDVEKLKQEDKERRKLGKEFDRRFGFTFDVNYNLQNSGVWKSLPNGDRIWQLAIKSPGALSINLTFNQYFLPQGADLFIVGKKNKIGGLTNSNNQADQKLGTGLIGGDELLLEYFEPAESKGLGKLEIGKATHGYKDPFSIFGWGEAASCEMNVNCPAGAAWEKEKRAVGRIVDNGDVCTGTLLNNMLQDGKPYFLTANHCFSASSSTWVFSFNWESPTCITPTIAIPEDETISGCVLRARNATSDFCLFELSAKPPSSFNAYYVGWNAVDVAPQSTTIIHHPSGDIKKITFDFDPSVGANYGNNPPAFFTHWKTSGYELLTTTEGGSSGSALFDQDHRVVGQLHGGPAACGNTSPDYYGKFSLSWNLGTTPSTRLKDWLDPTSSGLLAISGMDPSCKRLELKLPWKNNLDSVQGSFPYLWKSRYFLPDSIFQLEIGGYKTLNGKAFRYYGEAFGPAGRKDTLILSPISVNNYKNIKVRFKHAYRRKTNSVSDTLNLLLSTDCGVTFKKFKSWSGAGLETVPSALTADLFQPTDTTKWAINQFNLDSTYNKSSQLVFAFSFVSGNAGTLWMDDFEVLGDTSKNKPVAKFSSNKISACAGGQIQFEETSFFDPTFRTWIFEGGSPATSSSLNPSVSYANIGRFKVTLIVGNAEGRDTLVSTNYIEIFSQGSIEMPLFEDFSSAGVFPPVGYRLVNPENNITWAQIPDVNAPNSNGGSLVFNNYAQPNVTGQKDILFLPKISTLGKNHLKVRFRYAYKAYQNFGGVSPDTFTVGFSKECGGPINQLFKKGGLSLSTSGTGTGLYTPQPNDWQTVQFDLDSLLIYPELSFSFENKFGFGNRIFIDDIFIDTINNCPGTPVLSVNSDTICIGKTLVMSMDSIPDATYSWTGPANFTSSSRIATRNITTTTQSGAYVGKVTKDNCTSAPSTISILAATIPNSANFTQVGNDLTGPANFPFYVWIVDGDTLDNYSRTLTATISGTYTLVVYNAIGCFRVSTPKPVIITSNESILFKKQISLFPNPTNGVATLKGIGSNEFNILKVTNAIGADVTSLIPVSQKGETVEFNFSALKSGFYYLSVSGKNSIQNLVILKN
jgi:PKD repeat protein